MPRAGHFLPRRKHGDVRKHASSLPVPTRSPLGHVRHLACSLLPGLQSTKDSEETWHRPHGNILRAAKTEPRSRHIALQVHLRLSTLIPPELAAQAQVSEMLPHLENHPLPSPGSASLLQGKLQSGTHAVAFRLPSHHCSLPLGWWQKATCWGHCSQHGASPCAPCTAPRSRCTSSGMRPAAARTLRREQSWQGGSQKDFD